MNEKLNEQLRIVSKEKDMLVLEKETLKKKNKLR